MVVQTERFFTKVQNDNEKLLVVRVALGTSAGINALRGLRDSRDSKDSSDNRDNRDNRDNKER